MSADIEPLLKSVRLMAPYTMECTHCGTFIIKSHKINARRETTDEMYNDIPIYRFYVECTECSQEITFKTDPQTNDYQAEKGGKRIMGIDQDPV